MQWIGVGMGCDDDEKEKLEFWELGTICGPCCRATSVYEGARIY